MILCKPEEPAEAMQVWLARLRALYRELEEMEGVLQALTPEERLVLDWMVIRPKKKAAEQLCQMLELEKSSVYRRKNRALEKLRQTVRG